MAAAGWSVDVKGATGGTFEDSSALGIKTGGLTIGGLGTIPPAAWLGLAALALAFILTRGK